MNSLDATYRGLARPWQPDELAERYRATYLRGASDLPPGEPPPDRPLALLATAVPRLISLAVAANVLHILPSAATGAAALADELLSTIDQTAAGSLHRCHLALDATGHGRRRRHRRGVAAVHLRRGGACTCAPSRRQPTRPR